MQTILGDLAKLTDCVNLGAVVARPRLKIIDMLYYLNASFCCVYLGVRVCRMKRGTVTLYVRLWSIDADDGASAETSPLQ